MNLYALAFLALTWILLFLGTFVYAKNTIHPVNKSFFILILTATYWSFSDFGLQNSQSFESALLWHKFGVFWPIAPAVLFYFMMVYSERKNWFNNKLNYLFIFIPPVLMGIIDLTTNLLSPDPIRVNWGWNENPGQEGVFAIIDVLWASVLAIIALIICTHYYLNLTDFTKKQQAKYILFGMALPVMMGILTEAIFPIINVSFPELTILTFSLSCIVVGYAILKYQLFFLTPAMASEHIISTMSDLLFLITPKGDIQIVNQMVIDLLGYEETELIDKSFTILFEKKEADKLYHFNKTYDSIEFNQLHDIETILKTKDGRTILISLSNSILRDSLNQIIGFVYIARDITERKSVEKALRESEILYSTVVERAKDGILIVQEDTTTFANKALSNLTGYSKDEIVGMPFSDLVAPEARDLLMQLLKLRMEGKKVPTLHEIQIICKSGQMKDVELAASLIQYNGRHAAMGFVRDVTIRKQVEGILKDTKSELEQRVKERTSDLHLMNEQLRREIAERKLAETTLQQRLQIEHVLSEISAQFIGFTELDETINTVLAQIGKLMQVDYTNLFLINNNKTDLSLMYEWCNIGVRSGRNKLQQLPIEQIPWWINNLKDKQVINVEDVDLLPQEVNFEINRLEPIDTKSLIALPLYLDLEFSGFLGINDLQKTRKWAKEDIRILQVCTEIISWALIRQQAETSLRKSEQRYRLLAESVSDVIWTTNMNQQFTFVSPSIQPILGFNPTEFLSKNIKDVMTSGSFDLVSMATKKALSLEIQNKEARLQSRVLELELIRNNEATVWTETTVQFLRDHMNKPIGLLGVTRDITQRKLAQEARDDLERKRSNFIEITSHELRTPLTAILGYVELLERKTKEYNNPDLLKFFEIVYRNVQRLQRLIEGVSTLGQLERGTITLLEETISFSSFFNEAIQPYKIFYDNQIEVWDSNIEETVSIKGDSDRLLQVFHNLIDNAIKNTSNNERKILVTKKVLQNTIQVMISDNGAGIPQEALEQIFEPFKSIPTAFQSKGTGIGLYISREIVLAHNGTLIAKSDGKNCGATFILELPIITDS